MYVFPLWSGTLAVERGWASHDALQHVARYHVIFPSAMGASLTPLSFLVVIKELQHCTSRVEIPGWLQAELIVFLKYHMLKVRGPRLLNGTLLCKQGFRRDY